MEIQETKGDDSENDQQNWINISNQSGLYVSLGKHTSFVESCACNANFDPNRIFVAVQSQQNKLYVKSLDVTNPGAGFQDVMQVTLDQEQNRRSDARSGSFTHEDHTSPQARKHEAHDTTELTCYGSKLSDNGILWMCIFNKNMVIGVDVTKQVLHRAFADLPCPNDLCISKTTPDTLYVVCGTSMHVAQSSKLFKFTKAAGNRLELNVPAYGQIIMLDVSNGARSKVKLKKLGTLAGIESSDRSVYFTQLLDMCKIAEPISQQRQYSVAWQGNSIGSGRKTYLIDNVSKWDNDKFLGAIYRSVNEASARLMRSRILQAQGWSIAKAITSTVHFVRCQGCDAASNSEVLLEFSEQDVFTHCCFAIRDDLSGQIWNFKMAPPSVPEVAFDGHVTHIQRHAGRLIFINFKSDYVLLIDEDEVRSRLT